MPRTARALIGLIAAAAAAVALVAVLLPPAAAPQPGPSATPTPTGAASSPTSSPVPTTGAVASYRVYFSRDQLPPVGAVIQATGAASPAGRTEARIGALMRAGAQLPPAGATNPAALIRGRTTVSGGVTQTVPGLAVRIEGDLATAEFDIEDWGVRGAAITQGLLQQLVYTITEEPGIRRARIVEKGSTRATIDQLVVDRPLAREDVLEYSVQAVRDTIDSGGTTVPSTVNVGVAIDEPAPGMGRLMFELRPTGQAEPRWVPQFTARLREADGQLPFPEAKWIIEVRIAGSRPEGTSLFRVDKSPVRGVQPSGETWSVYLEDARPWRVAVTTVERGRQFIALDVGGPPHAVNANLAVYLPRAGEASPRTIALVGAARVFEAAVSWRLKDGSGRQVARGTTTASLGTSPVWGTFAVSVGVPPGVTGEVTLEVFWASPRDGSEQDVISVPVTIR